MKPLLQKIERSLGTDLRYVASGSFWLLTNQAVALSLSMVLLWVFANWFSKEVYGEYRFITTALSFLAITSLPGMSIALTRSVSQGNSGTLWHMILTRLRWGLIGSAIAILGAAYYYVQGDFRLASLFGLIALAVPLIETGASYQAYVSGLKNFRRYALSRITHRIILIVSTVSAIVLTENIIIIVSVFLITSIITDWLLLTFTVRSYPLSDTIDPTAVAYGKHLSFMSAIRLGSQYLDKISLWYFAGPVQVASYVVAVAIPNELTTGTAQISKLALPKMSTQDKTLLRKNLLRKTSIYTIAIIPIVVGYILIAPVLFNTFFPQYVDVVWYSQLATVMTFFAANGLLAQYFYATEHKVALYAQNIVEPVTLLVLYIALIPSLGILGAILASVIKHLILTVTFLWFFISDTVD